MRQAAQCSDSIKTVLNDLWSGCLIRFRWSLTLPILIEFVDTVQH